MLRQKGFHPEDAESAEKKPSLVSATFVIFVLKLV